MGPTEKGIATPVARQSHAPISKYASKYVGSVMNHLTEELLISREDHPKSVILIYTHHFLSDRLVIGKIDAEMAR